MIVWINFCSRSIDKIVRVSDSKTVDDFHNSDTIDKQSTDTIQLFGFIHNSYEKLV